MTMPRDFKYTTDYFDIMEEEAQLEADEREAYEFGLACKHTKIEFLTILSICTLLYLAFHIVFAWVSK